MRSNAFSPFLRSVSNSAMPVTHTIVRTCRHGCCCCQHRLCVFRLILIVCAAAFYHFRMQLKLANTKCTYPNGFISSVNCLSVKINLIKILIIIIRILYANVMPTDTLPSYILYPIRFVLTRRRYCGWWLLRRNRPNCTNEIPTISTYMEVYVWGQTHNNTHVSHRTFDVWFGVLIHMRQHKIK